MISRRQLVIALGASSIAAPFGSFAQQQGKVWRIGFLFAGTLAQRPQAQGFWEGLKELGYVPGKNILIEIREAEGKTEKLPDLAKELVSWKPDVIVAVTPPAWQRLRDVLHEAGLPVTAFGAQDTNHTRINDDLGVPDDPATKALFQFVDEALKK